MRRVLHVITGLHTGGAEGVLTSLLLAAEKGGACGSVVSLVPGGMYSERLRDAGITVRDLNLRHPIAAPAAVLRLRSIIGREQPKIIQSWMYHADLLSALALFSSSMRRRSKLLWGIRCSDLDMEKYGLQLRLPVRACARLSRLPEAIVANSEAGIAAHRRLGYRNDRFVRIDNGIDTERFQPDESARLEVRRELGISAEVPVIAVVARVDPMKDYDTFLSALSQLSNVRGIVAGKGTERLPDMPNLYRLGRRSDIPRILAATDILVSSSAFGEGFSNSIAEGMSTALPVVATDVGDARRIVGDAGIIVPAGDSSELAKNIRYFVQNREARQAAGRRARQRILDRFSLDHMLSAFGALYDSY